jgi:hypothetical protein
VKWRRTGFSNPLGNGGWCERMRKQGVTPVCDGLVCSSLEGDASSPSSWQLQGAQMVSSKDGCEESR